MKAREDEILISVTKKWFMNSSQNYSTFASDHLYPRLYDLGVVKQADHESAAEYTRLRGTQVKTVHRMMEHERVIPLSWKWAWLEAIPSEYRDEFIRRSFAMAGSLYVKLPTPAGEEGKGCLAGLSDLTKAFAEVMAYSEPAHDGLYDTNDNTEKVKELLEKLHCLSEVALTEIESIQTGTGLNSERNLLKSNIKGVA